MVRTRVLVLLVLMALAAGALVACGDGGGGGDATAPADSPEGMAERADFEGVENGELEVALEIDDHVEEEEINMRILGIFGTEEEDELPQLDMAVEANGDLEGEKIAFQGGLALLSDRVVLSYQGQIYEPDPETFEELESSFEESKGEGGEGDVTACPGLLEGIDINSLVTGLSNEGRGETLDGVPVTTLSGKIKAPQAFDAAVALTQDPACGGQLELAGWWTPDELREIEGDLSGEITERQVELDVDENDLLRRFAVDLTLVGPRGPQREKVEVDFDMRLTRVNEIQSFPVPPQGLSMDALAKRLGLNPLEAIEAGRGEGLGGLLEGISGSTP